jgi:hypothetical protein
MNELAGQQQASAAHAADNHSTAGTGNPAKPWPCPHLLCLAGEVGQVATQRAAGGLGSGLAERCPLEAEARASAGGEVDGGQGVGRCGRSGKGAVADACLQYSASRPSRHASTSIGCRHCCSGSCHDRLATTPSPLVTKPQVCENAARRLWTLQPHCQASSCHVRARSGHVDTPREKCICSVQALVYGHYCPHLSSCR